MCVDGVCAGNGRVQEAQSGTESKEKKVRLSTPVQSYFILVCDEEEKANSEAQRYLLATLRNQGCTTQSENHFSIDSGTARIEPYRIGSTIPCNDIKCSWYLSSSFIFPWSIPNDESTAEETPIMPEYKSSRRFDILIIRGVYLGSWMYLQTK
mmetsp:Transcript_8798/g.54032  ORF Transcript_8798/g.54032 Transcript_8798/m.54032 type:complete len:153 (-) Transcript_8798:1377-1835(-)